MPEEKMTKEHIQARREAARKINNEHARSARNRWFVALVMLVVAFAMLAVLTESIWHHPPLQVIASTTRAALPST